MQDLILTEAPHNQRAHLADFRMLIHRIHQFAVNEWRFRRLHRKYRNHTMTRRSSYAGNLHLARKVAAIEGELVECGTWRGGMIAGIADVLGPSRGYWLCDSFQGLPLVGETDSPRARAWQADVTSPSNYDNCSASADDASLAMSLSRAKRYELIKGWVSRNVARGSARADRRFASMRTGTSPQNAFTRTSPNLWSRVAC